MSTLNCEELDDIANVQIPTLVRNLCTIRSQYMTRIRNQDLPRDLDKKLILIGRLYRIWSMRTEQLAKEADNSNKESSGKEPSGKESSGKEPSGKEPSGKESSDKEPSGKESSSEDQPDSDDSVSDVEYNDDCADDIHKMLHRCNIESRLHRSVKGFTIAPNPQFEMST